MLEWFSDLDYSPEGKLLITKRVISFSITRFY